MNTKRYGKLLPIILLVIVIIGAITRANKNNEDIRELQVEIEDLEEVNKLYEKLVADYEILEINLTKQIDILEEDVDVLRRK